MRVARRADNHGNEKGRGGQSGGVSGWMMLVGVLITCCPVLGSNLHTYTVATANGMSTRQFQDVPNVVEVQCSGTTLGPSVELFSLTLYAIADDEVLASVSLSKLECATSSSFSACFVDRLNPFNTTLHTLVVDLRPGQQRLYGCNVSMNTAGRPAIIHWAIAASLRAEYGDPMVRSTTIYPVYTTFIAADIPVGADSQEIHTDVPVPGSAVLAGLVLLLVFIVLTVILVVVRHRGRRHSNSWYEPPSPSSPKDELYAKPSVTATDRDRKPGEGGALLGHVPPLGPAHLVTPPPGLVRYQSPVDDTNCVSGSDPHYTEPWGRPERDVHVPLKPASARATNHALSDVKNTRPGHVFVCDDNGLQPVN